MQEPLKRPDHKQKWMPAWSLKKEVIPAGKNIFGMSEDQVKEKQSKFGPIPRHVLTNSLQANSAELKAAIEDCPLDKLQSCFANSGSAPKTMSHRLIVMTVTKQYGQGNVTFASSAIQSQLVERYKHQHGRAVQDFLRASEGSRNKAIQSFRGDLFESIKNSAHETLQKGGDFTCRDLQTNEEFVVEFPCSTDNVKELPNHDAIKDLGADVYGQGKNNLGGIDAMLNAALFQMTVSQRHPIKARALWNVAEKAGGSKGLELYFVVDSYGFTPDFTKQSIL